MTKALAMFLDKYFTVLLEKWEKRPFVMLSFILLNITIFFGVKWWDETERNRQIELECLSKQDSLKTIINDKDKLIIEKNKYNDYNEIIDSTLITLFKENLLKK